MRITEIKCISGKSDTEIIERNTYEYFLRPHELCQF